MNNSKTKLYLERAFAFIAAIILFQTLFFKFSGAEETIWIFSQMGMEPWGRFLTGGIELIAGALLLFRRTSIYGAVLNLGTIAGAIFSHLYVLGIEVMGDGGALFMMALAVFAMSGGILLLRLLEVKEMIARILNRGKENSITSVHG